MQTPNIKATLPGYGIAILTSGLAGVLTGWISPFMGSASFFELFHMAVVVSAFCGGLGPGLLAATISFLVLDYFYIPPLNAFALGPHLWRMVLFAAVAVLTALLSGKLKRGKQELERAHAELEDRIRERTEELSRAHRRLVEEVAQRRDAERATLEAIAREQRRLGQDLHDGLCQTLAGVRLMVENLQARTGGVSRELDTVETQLAEALGQAYTISRGLYPVELETNGLMSALGELAARVSTVHPVQCRFRCPRPVAIHDNALAIHLYRIAQEAVVNGIKGGKASRVHLALHDRGATALLSIADNGTGFGNAPAPPGMGLKIMEHRARMINGELRFRSRRAGGTLVTCAFPTGAPPDGGNDAG
jgi:signal transduction histidine kinase